MAPNGRPNGTLFGGFVVRALGSSSAQLRLGDMRGLLVCAFSAVVALACSPEERTKEEGAAGSSTGGSATAGSGGSGGSSSGGTAGGSAGSSGSTAQGGAGAEGGSAGNAGSAGTGGSAGNAGSSATAGSGGTAATCTGNCLPPAPSGWSGPVAMYEGNSPPACVGDFAGTALTAKSEFEVGQSRCDCACDPPTGESCGNAVVCKTSNCFQLCNPGDYNIAPNTCVASGSSTGSRYNFANTPKYTATGCQPRPTTTIDPSGFRNDVIACDMADPGGTCDGGAICTPKLGASFQSACVIQAGDVPCPAGPYSVKVTTYSGFTDDRRCTSCTCGSATGTCNAQIAVVSGCTGLPVYYAGADAGQCSAAVSAPSTYIEYGVNPQGSCPPSAPGTTGEAKATGAATLCCLQPN